MTTVHEIAVGCETVTAVIDLTNPYNEARRAPYERTGMTENTTASDAADLTPEIECDCLVAWNRSEFGANQHDTVHPMYLTAFKSGYKAALAASAPAPQPAAPQGDGVPTWQAAQDPMLECSIQPRPLSHPLAAYHSAMSKGPLHYTWQDKPHRLVYDLIAAVKHYANQAGQAAPAPVAEDVEDAARYQWIRGPVEESTRYSRWRIEYWDGPNGWQPMQRERMDAAIDAARAQAAQPEGGA